MIESIRYGFEFEFLKGKLFQLPTISFDYFFADDFFSSSFVSLVDGLVFKELIIIESNGMMRFDLE